VEEKATNFRAPEVSRVANAITWNRQWKPLTFREEQIAYFGAGD